MPTREIQTCSHCKDSKRRCDKLKPSCSRCQRGGQVCIYPSPPTEEKEILEESENLDGLLTPSTSGPCSPLRKDHDPERVVKKRDRATLSCTRCHRLKVKCDKRQPCCSRCQKLGHDGDCTYTYKVQPPPATGSFVNDGDDAETVVSLWFLQKRGSSHWKALLTRLEFLSGLGEPTFQWLSMSVREHITSDCSKDFTLPGNFPFGSMESMPYRSQSAVRALLQRHRDVATSYIESYSTLYHETELFNTANLQNEVEWFWQTPEIFDFGWLAQYLAVLGLGAFAAGADHKLASELFFASELVSHRRIICLIPLWQIFGRYFCISRLNK
ncbi:hypothetical protein BU23DRAFT_100791 [Bimuria novae-zelandiae CBS 107.79]|uniref:Zn(2)-C6 fungal-type domain-containing protein n=1 Tax=Bimuria novae-zelandiae CBS 107.79 TaxID=1447943 RepID=A0A6A5VRM7_9PLEO|nr:hypothetical protein BU23DRAFT_100791 [Bimuria novae-zelandiae CBS 107.79]